MSCEVSFSDQSDDADPVEFVKRTSHISRKERTCYSCRETILVGQRYHAASYKFEGHFAMEIQCESCNEAANEFEFYLLGGDLWGMFDEEWEQGAKIQSCLMRMTTVRSKEHMLRRWNLWQEKKRQQEINSRKAVSEYKLRNAELMRWTDEGGS